MGFERLGKRKEREKQRHGRKGRCKRADPLFLLCMHVFQPFFFVIRLAFSFLSPHPSFRHCPPGFPFLTMAAFFPCCSVQYAVRWHFAKTKEDTFDRIFHRPIGPF